MKNEIKFTTGQGPVTVTLEFNAETPNTETTFVNEQSKKEDDEILVEYKWEFFVKGYEEPKL